MNTTAKTIMGITLAIAASAAMGILLALKKKDGLLHKIKSNAKELANNFTSRFKTNPQTGELTSELIDIE